MCSRYKAKFIIALITIICFNGNLFSQEIDYSRIFASDWEKAQAFVTGNETWMKQLSERYKVSYPIAVAIIFPELIRYSALRDKIEITLLKTLYINLGEEYADFSIGQFQMKPSFAESVHKMMPMINGRIRTWFNDKTLNDNIRDYRTQIVKDLENPVTQYIYLLAFIKICESIFNLADLDMTSRIKFLATAYNYSFQKDYDEVEKVIDSKLFNTNLFKTEYYSYSDISFYWYTTSTADSSYHDY